MTILYKKIDNQLHYWEIWENDQGSISVYWGVVGQQGETKTVEADSKKIISKQIKEHQLMGYREIPVDDMAILLIEYPVDGWGTPEDLNKRYALQERMQDILPPLGLGFCDGGSIGSGTMEVCCFVVDFDLAKSVIEKDLKDTEFADYSQIYNENADEYSDEDTDEEVEPSMHDPFDRRISFGDAGLVLGRLKNNGTAWNAVGYHLDYLLRAHSYFEGVPFLWVSIMFRYGSKNDIRLKFRGIDQKHGDLEVTLGLDMRVVKWADKHNLKLLIDIFMTASLEALIQVAKKYKLPDGPFLEECARYSDIPNTIEECEMYGQKEDNEVNKKALVH